MGFLAKRFVFNKIPCAEFGLRIYDLDGNDNQASPFANTGKIKTDIIPSKGYSFLYGRSYETPLEFTLIFGLDPALSLNMDEHLTRFEIDAIANWLTDTNSYKWLEIEQPDMEFIRYHCIISDLEPVQLSWLPWAFSAKIQCDSPYGYSHPHTFSYSCTNSSTNIRLVSRSTLNSQYYPKLTITLGGSSTISLVNQSCDNETLSLTSLPYSKNLTIFIDNDKGILKATNAPSLNLYPYFNFNWFPLKKGVNNIIVNGKCTVDFQCEFPVNFGG